MKERMKIIMVGIAVIHGVLYAHLDFDTSMKTEQFMTVFSSPKTEAALGINAQALFDWFRTSYEAVVQRVKRSSSTSVKIPKIIHQIWIGREFPQEFRAFQQSWQQHHPDWEYRLWTYDDIAKTDFRNKDLMLQCTNAAQLADLMRFEILYRHGGLYVDTDCECFGSFDELHHQYDLYVGLQPLDTGMVQLGIAVVGSIPGHPILRHYITTVRKEWHNRSNDIAIATGPLAFTKSFYACAHTSRYYDVALPAHYFYPLGCTDYQMMVDEWCAQGSLCVHHWAKTWLLPQFRRKQFQAI